LCEYTDEQILGFIEGEDRTLDQCVTVFCPNFRSRFIRLIKEDERKKPVISLNCVRQAEELEENIDDFTALGMFG